MQYRNFSPQLHNIPSAGRSVSLQAALGLLLVLAAFVGCLSCLATSVRAEPRQEPQNQTIPPIRVEIDSDPMVVNVGETITYTITVRNTLSDTSSTYTPTVIIDNVLPSEFSMNSNSLELDPSAEIDNTEQSAHRLTWRGQLNPTESIAIRYSGIVHDTPKRCAITNSVTVSEIWDEQLAARVTARRTLATRLASILCQVRLPQITMRELPVIVNGDFELGAEYWEQQPDSPALVVNTSELELPQANSGQWFAWLGGQNNILHRLSQHVEHVPAGIPGGGEDTIGIGISYLYWIASTNESCDEDQASVTVSRIGDDSATTQNTYRLCTSEVTWDQGREMNGWEQGVLALDGISGGELEIVLAVQTGSSAISNFFVDEVHLCSDNPNRRPSIRPCTK